MEAQRASSKAEWGVWRAQHRSINRLPWVYAANDEGCIVAWAEYGGDTGRTLLEAEAIVIPFLIPSLSAVASRGARPHRFLHLL
jgi:hypothetical protein